MSAALAHRPDIVLAVADYQSAIDQIVNHGDAGQDALEGALASLEARLLSVCGLDAEATNALLDGLYEAA